VIKQDLTPITRSRRCHEVSAIYYQVRYRISHLHKLSQDHRHLLNLYVVLLHNVAMRPISNSLSRNAELIAGFFPLSFSLCSHNPCIIRIYYIGYFSEAVGVTLNQRTKLNLFEGTS
uniref:Ovule protein n=1 Tax=Ascaris lumbricoides TaxID=6252 RepID=A0A0M3HKZ6_ASCLU